MEFQKISAYWYIICIGCCSSGKYFLYFVTFLGMAGIFLLLNADFLGLVQVLAYGGAVAVLIIFAVMLVQNSDNKKNSSGFTRLSPIAFFATILVNFN